MQPLKDYLNESSIQYEGILDPDQSKVTDRMTDDIIRQHIRKFCAHTLLWIRGLGPMFTKIDKDEKGWYVDTKSHFDSVVAYTNNKSYYDHCSAYKHKLDKQKGFLIEDLGIYFRWRKNNGGLTISDAAYLESTYGLPEEMDALYLDRCCQRSKKFTVYNNIELIIPQDIKELKILGRGCKNILINPSHPCGDITAPSGVKIYRPKDPDEYSDLRKKIVGY